jgi:hypothetical protein
MFPKFATNNQIDTSYSTAVDYTNPNIQATLPCWETLIAFPVQKMKVELKIYLMCSLENARCGKEAVKNMLQKGWDVYVWITELR